MKKYRIGLIIAATAIIIVEFFIIDFRDLFGSDNKGNYAVMLAMLMLIISQILSFKTDKGKIDN